jgi:hypothetical protein
VSSRQVLLNLRIPSLTVRPPDEAPKRIDNSQVRFRRVIELPALPKVGDTLDVIIGEGFKSLTSTVNSVNWDEREAMFVVACYAKPPIKEPEYQALLSSPDWEMRSLI